MKKYAVLFTREAEKRIDKLDASIRKIIQKAVDSLVQNPYKGKPLSHELAGLYSYRTSDYRIIYKIEEGKLIVIVITVGHRREIYKKLKEWLS